MDRAQVVIRLVLLFALAAIGWSSVYWVVYLALPALAAMRISRAGADYPQNDGPRLVRVLRWLAGAYAYLWLLTDAPPSSEPSGAVDLQVNPTGAPSTTTALCRLLTSLPALVVLAILSMAAALLWPFGAALILLQKRLPRVLFDFFLLKLSGQFRLVAYHLSLVDRYPSFDEGVAYPDASHPGTI